MLAATCLLAACPRKDAAPPGTAQPDPLADQPQLPTVDDVCEKTCARLDPCLGPLGAEFEVESAVLLGAFPFDCASCPGEQETATPAQADSLDCLPLTDCTAYYTCAAGHDPETAVRAQGGGSCESLCAREAACGGGTDGEAACLVACQSTDESDPLHQGLLGCATSRGCEGLLACVHHWSDASSGVAAHPEHTAQPGVSGTCQALCDRSITCGAEEQELSESELAELRSSLSGLFVECAVQCEAERKRGGAERIDACVASDTCEAFTKCSDDL